MEIPFWSANLQRNEGIGHVQMIFNRNLWGLPLNRFQLSVELKKKHFANALATLSSIIKIFEETDVRPIMAETYDQSIYCCNVDTQLDDNPWYTISEHS